MGELETLPVLSAGRLRGRVSKFEIVNKLQNIPTSPMDADRLKNLGGRVMGVRRWPLLNPHQDLDDLDGICIWF
ncbi:hypothetical protein SAMN02745119_02356 [Trichlorobacter thiogenes]|uniref:Uncharacterized protein n=1 Tax=Trichlorobacter thiogenes TaxID=115783 RepID=A0A1T4QEI0_9BACT|nr:hypothetical protein SAMN02745119_02356 [Trichlorobacter thiogenes]